MRGGKHSLDERLLRRGAERGVGVADRVEQRRRNCARVGEHVCQRVRAHLDEERLVRGVCKQPLWRMSFPHVSFYETQPEVSEISGQSERQGELGVKLAEGREAYAQKLTAALRSVAECHA